MQAIQQKQNDLGDGRLADMDAAGTDVQVLSLSGILLDALDPSTATTVSRDANDRAAEAVGAHPSHFAAFVALGLKEPKTAADELRRCVQELGFEGGIVNGTTDGLFLDDPRFLPVFFCPSSRPAELAYRLLASGPASKGRPRCLLQRPA